MFLAGTNSSLPLLVLTIRPHASLGYWYSTWILKFSKVLLFIYYPKLLPAPGNPPKGDDSELGNRFSQSVKLFPHTSLDTSSILLPSISQAPGTNNCPPPENSIIGVLDCCTLIKEVYKSELNIDFECHGGHDGWWDNGENRYLDNYEKQGFVRILDDTDVIKYDIFLIKLVSPVPNHAAVYLGDGKILHHVHGRLSNREPYGGYWRNHTTHHLRHKSLC